ncbi:hypothetical protein [Shewanella algae]|uniref:hypothetical protein n=1 Tax=Shewanella algae TaxID=38313 RepID=UPI0031F4EA86
MLFLLEAQLFLRIILNIDFDRPSVNDIYNHWMAGIWPWISTLGRMNADSDKAVIMHRGLIHSASMKEFGGQSAKKNIILADAVSWQIKLLILSGMANDK